LQLISHTIKITYLSLVFMELTLEEFVLNLVPILVMIVVTADQEVGGEEDMEEEEEREIIVGEITITEAEDLMPEELDLVVVPSLVAASKGDLLKDLVVVPSLVGASKEDPFLEGEEEETFKVREERNEIPQIFLSISLTLFTN